ncbi:Werner Syndrome-like exonuclease isoform X2 [Macadamia integrifolia]|uniref:Werner Syndrome-like exonuclease isoform X2 n=1 Tax=Macadamia integrifolia TaxID=60698 RepID=UPI001C4EF4F6|nr:Werner Syndrome-like exonuclease isoform X2 [Macadamia integrifolia]
MESSGEPSLPSAPDWDRPITQAELDAIEAAFTHAATSSSTKRRRSSSPGAVEVHSDGRRLPSSLGRCQKIPSLDRSEVENCSSTGGDSFVPRIGQWNPVYSPYQGYAQRKAAVIQICGDSSNCYVMHIIHSGIPPILRTLLEDLTSLKVGICIANDANKIFNDYNVRVKPVEDLSSLANSKVGGSRKWSLSSLTEMLTCKQLEKPDKIRLGDWEANILSREQLQYAATDAFVSWYLYQVLQNFPDASESKSG